MARHAACLRLNFAMLDLLFALLDRELTLAKPSIGFPLFSLAWIGCVVSIYARSAPRMAAAPCPSLLAISRFPTSGRSLRAGDCPHGCLCATPERLDLQRRTHDADDKLGVVPDPATCPQPQPSDDRPIDRSEHEAASAPARSFGSPPSHATPNVATTACPSDISIGDAGDISIGDLHGDGAD